MPDFKAPLALVLAAVLLAACATRPSPVEPAGRADPTQRPWESIRLAMLECAERYWVDTLPEECSIEVDASTPPDLLGRGLHLAWTGRIPDAREMIDGLHRDAASPLVIAVLTLETELGSGNLVRGRALLEEMAGLPPARRPPEGLLLAYRAALAARSAQWPELLALIEPLGEERIANDRAWLSAYARATGELGHGDELEAMLALTRDEGVLGSGSYLLAHWELAQLRGEEMALADFRVGGREQPDDVNVRHAVISNRIGREYDGSCSAACDELLRLLEARNWDLQRALGVARSFAFLREGGYANRALAAAPASQRELDALVGYQTLLAWDAVLQADPYQAMVRAQGVLEAAPRDMDANWIKAMVAINWEDQDMLAEAMDVMRTASPLSPLFLSLWRGIDARAGHEGLCRVATSWSGFLDDRLPAHLGEAASGVRAHAAACAG
ncbi:hypothetical protein [Alkalisalibacterium limincola]|uniref:Tetratricopeptide repeat protein n=1 Tax=Alkalisalibacterium limincola TaxID=2699169 RepID=A0A5C8KQR1_9GAMM|nr:hypothetical protein [Alkalisalibacterium limincola]TXK62355.1 hypothetical protein FU658_09005 [Alkalisalibacterium limincola]